MNEPISPLPRPLAEPLADHAMLVAGAAINQASTPTALLAGRLDRMGVPQAAESPLGLVQVFASHPRPSEIDTRGSFHPRIARASAGKARSRLMKPGFTLAF